MIVLVFNAGSSSLKAGLYDVSGDMVQSLFTAEAEAVGRAEGRFSLRDSAGREMTSEQGHIPDDPVAAERFCRVLTECGAPKVEAIGHRIVHGGPDVTRHTIIDAHIKKALRDAQSLAPLHVPPALAILDFAESRFPDVPQVACLDTAFHAELPAVARTLPVDPDVLGEGIHRYGFHGLSCESIIRQLGDGLPHKLIVAHLGGGASVTAIANGRSVDTSMGLTPMGGIMMGSRSGDLDPGLLIYLMREKGLAADALEHALERQSGLAGVSAISGDVRVLDVAARYNPRAQLALDMFRYSVRKQIAAMAAALGGVDCLVFTGGIGEHDRRTREAICADLAWMGIFEDTVRVLPADENHEMATHAARLTA